MSRHNKQKEEFEALEKAANQDTSSSGSVPFGVMDKCPEDSLGDRIQQAREAKGLTQGELADRTKTVDLDGKGLSRAVISLYERGTNKPGPKELRMLCEALRITPSYLIYGSDDPFDTFLERWRYGLLTPNKPDYFASLVYCFYRLHSSHRAALMELMMSLLRSEVKGFDEELAQNAEAKFLEMADAIRAMKK